MCLDFARFLVKTSSHYFLFTFRHISHTIKDKSSKVNKLSFVDKCLTAYEKKQPWSIHCAFYTFFVLFIFARVFCIELIFIPQNFITLNHKTTLFSLLSLFLNEYTLSNNFQRIS